ncbi:serpin family protein [Pseudothermotoga sp.]|nr:serpin family protein [Pseudothermotoga sp.]MCX7812412.1 serpin family protein [Pseudothermotoga sp.]MDW8140134.1 serpin family protein [Pseudothermotoga sp.]
MRKTWLLLASFLLLGLCFAIDASDSVNLFGIDLYKTLASKDGNIFFSPFSLSTALAMTYLGANGKTAEQMGQVLHFKENVNIHESFSKLIASLNEPSQNYKLSVANALWLQKNYPLLQSFLDAVERYYKAPVNIVDFVNELGNSVRKINAWIEEKTDKKIKDMITENDVDSLTRLILTNAIYFKGVWEVPFDPSRTEKDLFYIDETTSVEVNMMKLTAMFKYFEDEEAQILQLPYAGGRFSMVIVLPKKSVKLSDVEKRFSLQKLMHWLQSLEVLEVQVYLPRFKVEQRFSLKEVLTKMGMVDAFTDSADFSKMDGTKMLKIQNVIHQAFVEVNEEGTEAAAATAVIIGIKMGPKIPIIFKVDRPFLFFIYEKSNNVILFMGRVMKP